jgi:two-component system cell cycle response regulator
MHVAVVDPSRTVLKCVAGLLQTCKHEVTTFCDGAEALEVIQSHPEIVVLITSVELPAISGLDLCRQARACLPSFRRPIYIIVMSASGTSEKIIDALDAGADEFIGKPPVAEELYARLRAAERLATLQQELIRFATEDPLLPGVLNRRAFFEKASEVCVRAQAGDSVCGIMIDADHFKRINDLYGHAVGDDALRTIASVASEEGGIFGRLGGEEFAMLLQGCTASDARVVAERMRANIAQGRMETQNGIAVVTCSFGVSQWKAGETIDELLRRADLGLYEAKARGRNCIVINDKADDPIGFARERSIVRASGRPGNIVSPAL